MRPFHNRPIEIKVNIPQSQPFPCFGELNDVSVEDQAIVQSAKVLPSNTLAFCECFVYVVFCCLQIFHILVVHALRIKQMYCIVHYCDPYEDPVDIVPVDWDVELIQRPKSSLYSAVVVSRCFEVIYSSSGAFE